MSGEKKDGEIRHTVTIDGRKRLTITGVTDTDKFDENTVLLYTCMGEMIIKGKNLRVNGLSVESGDMLIEGDIDSVVYGDRQIKSPLSIMGRLLK